MSIPHSALAAAWIPFVIVFILTIFFSFLYIRYFQSRYESEVCSTLTSMLGLSVALLTSALLPVDIFLVSFMKDNTGHFKEWAKDEAMREFISQGVQYAYFALYLLVVLFVFLILPFAYFFYEEGDEQTTTRSRFCTAFKYSIVFVLFAAVIFLIGGLVPFRGSSGNSTDTEWAKIEHMFTDLGNHGETAISFTVSVLCLIGMLSLILYTGYGITAWPMDLVKGRRSVNKELTDVAQERTMTQNKIEALRNKYPNGGRMSSRDKRRLEELQGKEDHLLRQVQQLDSANKSWMRRLSKVMRPCNILIGVLLLLLALLVFVSLLMTNIDKLLHSMGPQSGYTLLARKIPNPMDIVLTYTQKAFPLDYIMICSLIMYFLFCSMGGIQHIGVWFCWIRMYKIRPRRTKPQGLLFLCFLLMFIIIAINVLVYQLTPQYSSFGSQHFWQNQTVNTGNGTYVNRFLVPCVVESDECVMTQVAYLLLRFFFNLWFFGAAYYWMSWAFLVVVLLGFLVTLCRKRRSAIEGAVDDDDFVESDEEIAHA